MTEQTQEQSKKERIIELLKKGYTRTQLINDFGFAERTVDAAIKEYRELYGSNPEAGQTKSNGEAKGETLPAKAKAGEVIIPEWIAREMVNIFDGSERDQRLLLAGIAIPLMGVRLIQEMVKPLTEMMLAMRKEELQAMIEAQGMAKEVAERAAQDVGAQVIQALRQQSSASARPMEQLMADMLRQPLNQLVTKVMGMSMPQARPGAQFQPNQPGLTGQPGSQSQTGYQVTGHDQVSKEEIKEVFND